MLSDSKALTRKAVVSEADGIALNIIANERELVKKLQSRDPKAIEALSTIYLDRLYSLVFHSVKQDQAAAEEIVQDVFIIALRSAKGFKGQTEIFTWLARIAHRKIIDYYRREQKEHFTNDCKINDDLIDSPSIVDDGEPISERLESDEMGHVVIKAMSSLPLDYQQALLFKYVEEMTVLEISQVMNRSPKSVEM
jgi:RNA polymerase sigma-70 factor (ECF subfamily)